jgi:putative DNA primase/helicase
VADTENENVLDELESFIETLEETESSARAAAFRAFFSLKMTERLAAVPDSESFRFEIAFTRLASIRGLSGRAKEVQKTVDRARKRAAAQQQDALLQQITQQGLFKQQLPEFLTDHLPNYLIPGSYDLDLGGIYSIRVNEDGGEAREKVATAPIIMTHRGRDADSGHMQVEVAWVEPPGNGRGQPAWRVHTVDRSTLFDSKKLINLIDYGAPISSVNVSEVIKWLTAFEDINQSKIPLTNGTSRLGWQSDGSFILPDRHIRTERHQELKLFPAEGMSAISRSLRVNGTWDGWLQTIELLRDHPLAMIALYTSVASVLGHITKCDSFAVDWSNETSSGKTTSLRIAASVWGYPDDGEDGYIATWNSTQVWVERAAGFLHSLPLLLDETKTVKNKKHVADVLYMFSKGQGRGRGNLVGVDDQLTWSNTLLSTGEARLTSFTQDGGVRARVLALQGAPISGPPATARVVADSVRSQLYANYGHLGRRVAEYLVHYRDHWDALRKAFEDRRNAYASMSTTKVGGRLAAYVAQLDLAQAICETLGVPTPTRDPIEYLIQAVRDGGDDADQPREAFTAVISWCALNQARFYKSIESVQQGTRSYDFAGKWANSNPDWETINFDAQTLKQLLFRFGFEFEEVVPSWKRRGWIDGTKRGYTKSVSIKGVPMNCVCLKREMFDELIVQERPDIDTGTVPPQVSIDDTDVLHDDARWGGILMDN